MTEGKDNHVGEGMQRECKGPGGIRVWESNGIVRDGGEEREESLAIGE